MTVSTERLFTALADRYRLERELQGLVRRRIIRGLPQNQGYDLTTTRVRRSQSPEPRPHHPIT